MIIYDSHTGTTEPGVIQFENSNEGRSYPFADDAILTTDGGTTLPDDVVADLHLVIPVSTEASLASVYISDKMISICARVTSEATGSTVAALSCTVRADTFEPYVPYRFEKLAGSEDVGGIVTFGQIEFPPEPVSYRFSQGKAKFAGSAVAKYAPADLRRIVDPRSGESLSGDVAIEFSAHVDVKKEPGGIRLSLKPGSNNTLLSACDRENTSEPCGATPVHSINGVRPDENDRIVIWFH